jgi:hypothetical protein
MGHGPWAILRRHPLGPEVPQHSANPCLEAASETWFLAVNPQTASALPKFVLIVNSACDDVAYGTSSATFG